MSVCLKNFAEILVVNLAKNFASRLKFVRDSRQDRAEILVARNLLLGEDLVEIRVSNHGEILAAGNLPSQQESRRFWPTGI